jgi:tetratricopeptide (TPR) repeat protein
MNIIIRYRVNSMKCNFSKYSFLINTLLGIFIIIVVIAGSYAFSVNIAYHHATAQISHQEEDTGDDEQDDVDDRTDEEQRQSLISSRLRLGDSSLEAGFLDEAVAYYEEMKSLLDEDDYLLWALYCNRMGRVEVTRKNTAQAIEDLIKGNDYYKMYFQTEAGMDDNLARLYQADNLVELSIAHRMHGNMNQAMEKADDALLLYKAYGDNEGRAKAYTSKGNIHYMLEEWDDAEKYYKRALEIYEKELNYASVGRLYNNIAVIYVMKGDEESAIEFYNISIDYKKASNDMWGVALTYRNIAVLYETQDDLINALSMMEECVKIAQENNDPNLTEYLNYLNFIKMRLEEED